MANVTDAIIRPGKFALARSGLRRRSWLVPAAVIFVVVVLTVLAPILTPYGQAELGDQQLSGPSAAHWFGTDELGRDLLTRILYGGQISLLVAAGATVVSMVLGIAWGLGAALARPLIAEPLMRLADVILGIPGILLALVFVAAFDTSIISLIVIIGILLAPPTARLVRAVGLTEIQSDYAVAARAYGASPVRLDG